MKTTFKTDVIRTDTYDITIDEKVWNKEKLKEYSRYFNDVKEVSEISAQIGFSLMRFGTGKFIEGFGHIKTLRRDGSVMSQFIPNFKIVDESEYCAGITIKVISEDEEIETVVEKKEVIHER